MKVIFGFIFLDLEGDDVILNSDSKTFQEQFNHYIENFGLPKCFFVIDSKGNYLFKQWLSTIENIEKIDNTSMLELFPALDLTLTRL